MRFGHDGSKVLCAGGAAPGEPFARIGEAAEESGAALVHDEGSLNEGFVYGLADLDSPDFPMPLGVLRALGHPTYEELLARQVEEATRRHGPADLEALLASGDCWTVD
jgi:2-oxoglutarate ferredoxin oxidoreductase subunit beta